MKRKIPEVSITELWISLGGEVSGRDTGLNRKAKCIIHNDSNASASLNEGEGLWFCQTCNLGGDAIQLIMEVRGAGFSIALSELEGFASGSNRPVSPERSRSSLLPGGSGRSRERGGWVAPWSRL